jgi:hypothetical protein
MVKEADVRLFESQRFSVGNGMRSCQLISTNILIDG